ncbi:MAG: pyrroline-5-carboxylate reductase [Eubacterium sp.]|nr:pyrroline-5-carboxylate reductase [Eubacterium sp.]
MSIGFIGCGNMASAIIKGIISADIFPQSSINVFDINEKATKNIKSQFSDINVLQSENEIVKNSDTVILAVKPNVLAAVLDKINLTLEKKSVLLISIAAGKDLKYIRNSLSHDNRIIRVMPNINAVVGEAMSAYTANATATEEDKALCKKMLEGFGKAIYLDEKLFPLFGVIGGCAPAFSYMYIDALARAAVQNGMNKDTALKIAAQTVYGSAKMVLESGEHPYELIDRVCSPGGTTIEGIASLQADKFESTVNKAVKKALEKDSKL